MNPQIAVSPTRKRLYSVKEESEYLGRSIPSVREILWVLIDIHDMNAWITKSKVTFMIMLGEENLTSCISYPISACHL